MSFINEGEGDVPDFTTQFFHYRGWPWRKRGWSINGEQAQIAEIGGSGVLFDFEIGYSAVGMESKCYNYLAGL